MLFPVHTSADSTIAQTSEIHFTLDFIFQQQKKKQKKKPGTSLFKSEPFIQTLPFLCFFLTDESNSRMSRLNESALGDERWESTRMSSDL